MAKTIPSPLARFRRLQGQLAGAERMLERNASASDVIQQLEAVRGSICGLESELIRLTTSDLTDPEVKKIYNYLLKLG